MMKTIVVDTLDKAEIQKRIAAEKPKEGDSLRFLFENPEATALVAVVFIVLIAQMINKVNREQFAQKVIDDLFGNNRSIDEVEKEIEKEYGIKIQLDSLDDESVYETVPNVNYGLLSSEEVIKQFQERALISWGGKIDADAFLNEIRGSE